MRRVLFDEDVPRQLRRDLPELKIRTVQEEGWSSAKNGELLRLSSPSFDVLVTAEVLAKVPDVEPDEAGRIPALVADTARRLADVCLDN